MVSADIEIQIEYDVDFSRRSLFYWAQIYGGQLNRGEKYKELTPVICINFVDFKLFPSLKPGHNWFIVVEGREKEYILSEDMEIHFIELPKSGMMKERLENWIKLLKHAGTKDETMKVLFERDPIFRQVNEDFKNCIIIDEVKDLAQARAKYQRDTASRIFQAHETGKKEEKMEIAKKMLKEKFDINTIQKITGLSEEEIASLV